ncbi:hypothetical protein Tsubulata_007524 [Turnera subulata]|uniref:Cyanobacterial aminoacyl-tRNA synthetase CAAD domain-containing protein n=1 Tax=Turnera subulata TaxID=218843 RepID=A0A9Q0G138_9ROSI|nr:hypothetical protein Tsubulata_007524 [Turnera subulata]
MELCTTATTTHSTILRRRVQCLPQISLSPAAANFPARLRQKPSLALKQSLCSRLPDSVRLVPSASFSDDTSIGTSRYGAADDDRSASATVVTVEESPAAAEESTPSDQSPTEESPSNAQSDDLLGNLNLKGFGMLIRFVYNLQFDSEDSYYSILLYGGGALAAVWLASAVVSAIDSIPLFPKLMEVVGLGYTFWFTTRYLLFKKNRDELFAKVEELKQQVLGSNDD